MVPPRQRAISDFLALKIGEVLELPADSIDRDAPLTSFGLDSIVVFDLVGELACRLHRDIDANLLWKYPTIEAAAEFLALESQLEKAAEISTAGFIDLPPDEALKRPVVEVDARKEVLIARGNSGTTVICFSGQLYQMCMAIEVFDRYLAEHDFTAVYVRDFGRHLHLVGVNSLGISYRNTVDALAALNVELGTQRLLTIGNSGGGLASITYGMDLKASKILMFSGPTCLSRMDVNNEPKTGIRLRPVVDVLSRLKDQGRIDVKLRFEREIDRTSETHLFYGALMDEDRLQAERLAGMKGVFFHPVPGFDGHDTIRHLARQGALRGVLRAILC